MTTSTPTRTGKPLMVRLGDRKIEHERRIKSLEESLAEERQAVAQIDAVVKRLTPEYAADLQRVLEIYGVNLDELDSCF